MNITFHLGLHKTASTWFQSVYFTDHPEIEILNNFRKPWNDELIRYLVLNDAQSFDSKQYKKLVTDRIKEKQLTQHNGIFLISAERLSGHPYSGGFDREKIALNISKAYPNAKIFLFIRNQVDIVGSVYKQLVNEGYLGTIKELLNENSWKSTCFNLEYYNYFRLQKLYNRIFGQENLQFFLFEEFVENCRLLLEQICQFLNISYFNLDSRQNRQVNAANSNYKIRAIRQLNHFRRTEYNKYPKINLNNNIMYKILLNLLKLYPYVKNIELDKKDATTIKDYFASSNRNLFEKGDLKTDYLNNY